MGKQPQTHLAVIGMLSVLCTYPAAVIAQSGNPEKPIITGTIANPAGAAGEVYLSFDGNEDDPAADKNHDKWIAVESWNWGQSTSPQRVAPSEPPTGDGSLTLVRPMRSSAPKIQEACTSGKRLQKIVFSQRSAQQGKSILHVLEDVAVSCKRISTSGSSRMEQITLNFKKIRSAPTPGRMKGDFSRETIRPTR